MIVSYDNLAGAVYIKIRPEVKVARTVEFAPETFVDLDKDGELIGIEMLNPGQLILKRIARKFHRPELFKVHPHKLQEAIAS